MIIFFYVYLLLIFLFVRTRLIVSNKIFNIFLFLFFLGKYHVQCQ